MPQQKKTLSSKDADIGSGDSVEAPDSAAEMSADEQDAFDKIMREIEGGGDNGANADQGTAEADRGVVSEADFSAELEKVVQQAGADGDESDEMDADGDELDADQQKAFESIMSQIEGGGDSETSVNRGAAEADDGTATGDNPSDGLEKVFPQATVRVADESGPSENAVEMADTEEKEDDANADSDDSLDADQQEAFESIMAQIEGGQSEKEESEGELEVAKKPQPEVNAMAAQTPGVDPLENGAGEGTGGTPADIDEILKAVAVEDDETDVSPPKSTGAQIVVEPNPAGDKASPDPDESEFEIRKVKSIPQAECESVTQADIVPGPQRGHRFKPRPKADAAAGAPDKKATALREAAKPSTRRWKKIAMGASAVALLLAGLAGYRYWPRQPVADIDPEAVASQDVVPKTATPPAPFPASRPRTALQQDRGAPDRSKLKTAAENLDRLRDRLLAKKAEIEELRTYYQAGIDAEINGIIALLKTTNKDSAAMADPRIGLGLSAIQRRDTYIRKLVRPVDELNWNSEELLYFSRRAELLALMATKTSDIDIDGFIRQSRELIARHARALEELNIDDVSVPPLSTETIWNDITSRIPKMPPNAVSAAGTGDNDRISEQICSGNYSRKHKLTVLSPKTARCLAGWKGKDLFLNELKELDPEAARQLANWKGEWLGLNGLEELSPEAAVYLSRWKGKGLSLNGLSRLSPRVVAILSEWQGDQIELVNVKHMAHWENPKTRLFLSEEMNRKRHAAKE